MCVRVRVRVGVGVGVCVCVCARARVRVRVRVYSLTVKASSVCNVVWDILEGMDQRSCVVSIILGASQDKNSISCQTEKKSI